MKIDIKDYQRELIDFFATTTKTGWGKNEIVAKLKELYIEYLEKQLEKKP